MLTTALLLTLAWTVSAAGPAFVASPQDGASCSAVCSSTSQNMAALQQFNADNPVSSSACAANVTGVGLVAGYQLSGNTSCTTVWNDEVVTTTDFSCLCLDQDDSMGIVRNEDQTCQYACDQVVDGLAGMAVTPEASTANAACLPSTEIGELNRFGHTLPTESGVNLCYHAADGAVSTTADYSCFCTFAPQGSALAPSSNGDTSDDTLATGG